MPRDKKIVPPADPKSDQQGARHLHKGNQGTSPEAGRLSTYISKLSKLQGDSCGEPVQHIGLAVGQVKV